MKVGAVLPAAGSGSRFGRGENKVWAELLGRSVLEWSIRAFAEHPLVEALVVVVAEHELSRARELTSAIGGVHAVVPGGKIRAESVRAGLAVLPDEVETVLVHDAARPAVTARLIEDVLRGVASYGAAIPGVPLADTVKRADGQGCVAETLERSGLWAVQTPQGARRSWLEDAYRQWNSADPAPTDEAALLERAGYPVFIIPGDPDNVKVTLPEDLARVERILTCRSQSRDAGSTEDHLGDQDTFRTGFGYDVHRIVDGRPLWLGGVEIPHTAGLLGHSDADVVMHAVCDSILGAVGEGDIGVLFPDTDPRNRDRRSCDFVREAARRATARGWRLAWLDVTLVAEQPRVGPYRQAMREAIGEAAGIPAERISIKATTNEGIGFVGRKEGMACWAVATLVRAPSRGGHATDRER